MTDADKCAITQKIPVFRFRPAPPPVLEPIPETLPYPTARALVDLWLAPSTRERKFALWASVKACYRASAAILRRGRETGLQTSAAQELTIWIDE